MNDPHDRPKIAHEPISVLLPVFNQVSGLEPIANAWLRELDRLDRSYEFIIVDDASADGTAAVLEKLSAAKNCVGSRRGLASISSSHWSICRSPAWVRR